LIVAPNTDAAVIRRALDLGLTVVPGFATPTEAFQAIRAGARILKLFPAAFYGPGYLRAIGAVLPKEVTVLAVGGVDNDNIAAWSAAGAAGFGIGGELYRPGREPDELRRRAFGVAAACRAIH